ncbi:AEC family transporter [Thalassotalea sp. PLHSN55]|uniref:AEC family transporter n=1 Tax=Thalassotalea sp. PLHSN55 TaxID=3435888 RepID=UPI003F87F75E
MTFFQLLNAALQVTTPLLIILVIGITFKRIGFVDQNFVAIGNKLVFKVALPALLFLSVANGSADQTINFSLIYYAMIATVVSVALVWLICSLFLEPSKRGVFTQCAFRGNMGIVGFVLCVNAYGESVLVQASIYLGCLTILYNVLSVILLSNSKQAIINNLTRNPLIWAIVSGFLWSFTHQPLPVIIDTSIGYLAKLTLPLALICIGASLDWSSLKSNHSIAIWCSSAKLVILPALVCAIAIMLGITGQSLGILFLMMSSPTAAAAYVMTQQMTSHGKFAAEVITLSTILSPISVTLGLVLLKHQGYM